MPRIRTLTPGASPMHFFGSEVRRAREAAGMTQADLGALVPCDNSTVSRVEAGILAPDEAFALACDNAFPHVGGWFTRFYRECNGWSAPFPSWFEDWLKAEQEATTLRIWQPIIIPGLLQTPEYARTLFLAGQDDTSARRSASWSPRGWAGSRSSTSRTARSSWWCSTRWSCTG